MGDNNLADPIGWYGAIDFSLANDYPARGEYAGEV